MNTRPQHRVLTTLATLAVLAACGATSAAPSRLADESDVVEAGDCEIEAAVERHRVRGEAPERQSSLQLVCGIGWRTELQAEFARRRGDGSHGQAIGLEARSSLRASSLGRPGWAVMYGASSERHGTGPWHQSDLFVALEAAVRPAPGWLVAARVGTARDRRGRSDSTTWALSVEHGVNDALELGAGLRGDDRSRPLISLEVRWHVLPDQVQLNLSGGASSGPQRQRRIGLGLTFEF